MPAIRSICDLGGTLSPVLGTPSIVLQNISHLESNDLEKHSHFLPFNHFSDLKLASISDAYLSVDFKHICKHGAFVAEFSHSISDAEINATSAPGSAELDWSNTNSIIGSNWMSNNYFHWMVEALPSIFAAVTYQGLDNVRIVVPKLSKWQEAGLSKLGYDGLGRFNVEPGKWYQLSSLRFNSHLTGRAIYSLSFYSFILALKRATRLSSQAPSRIYVARTDATARQMANEAALIEFLKRSGFAIIVPGLLSLDEQINIFNNAKVVVGSHGAGLTNIMFCNPGTKVYELLSHSYPVSCFKAIAETLSLDYYADFFQASLTNCNPQLDPWEIELDKVKNRVRSILC